MSYINKTLYLVTLIFATLFTPACESWLPNAHRPSISMGNVIKPDTLEKIQLGMTRSEITPILGTPVLVDPFRTNRWDYIYRYYPRGRTNDIQIESRITLFFEDDVLVKIDDSLYVEPKPDHEKQGDAVGAAPSSGGGGGGHGH